MSAIEIVSRFLELIGHRDADKLADMMTEDHVFIDSLGHAVRGREEMRKAWRGYFTFVPDYCIARGDIPIRKFGGCLWRGGRHDIRKRKASSPEQMAYSCGVVRSGRRWLSQGMAGIHGQQTGVRHRSQIQKFRWNLSDCSRQWQSRVKKRRRSTRQVRVSGIIFISLDAHVRNEMSAIAPVGPA